MNQELPCHECGKPIKNPHLFIEIFNGGSSMRTVNDSDPDEADAGYCGWHPIGSDCARRLRKKGVVIYDDKTQA